VPTTSSPWASPSSPAGRRLLQSEPATADDIPILDEATLALGAALVAASAPATAVVAPPASPARRRSTVRARARSGVAPAAAPGRRGLVAAALVMGLLAVGATAGLDRPAPAASAPVEAAPLALGRAAGAVLGAETPAPVPGGRVVVGLIEPTEAVGAAPFAPAAPTLAARLGHLVALAAEDA
jgi:hypothetical protein